jgi:hypothetical protein
MLRELLARPRPARKTVWRWWSRRLLQLHPCRYLAYPLKIAPGLRGTTAAITRIDFKPGSTEILYVNRAEFLPRELIT